VKNNLGKTQIGIFDSGLGGLSVWSEVVRLMPNQPTIYFADAANCPYGGKTEDEIFQLTEKGIKWLLKSGARIIIIACNTATGAAIEQLRAKYPEVPFVGIEPAIKKAVENSSNGIIGIMATKFTLQSKKYLNTKNRYAKNCKVIEQVGEGLVELVENDEINSDKTTNLLIKYLTPMIEEGADTLVLGCTHYPFLKERIKEITNNKIEIIDPAPYVVKHTIDIMGNYSLEKENGCRFKYQFHSTKSAKHSHYIRKRALEIINGNGKENNN